MLGNHATTDAVDTRTRGREIYGILWALTRITLRFFPLFPLNASSFLHIEREQFPSLWKLLLLCWLALQLTRSTWMTSREMYRPSNSSSSSITSTASCNTDCPRSSLIKALIWPFFLWNPLLFLLFLHARITTAFSGFLHSKWREPASTDDDHCRRGVNPIVWDTS